MKPLAKAAATAIIVGALVFGVVFLIGYSDLLAHQPPHELGKPWPPDVTSFPPSAAWVSALPFGVGALVVAFFVAGILFGSKSNR